MKNTIILLTMLLFSGIGFAQESNNGKQLWAKSFLNEKAPELTVETWISKKPDTEGKFVIIDFWATWCGGCRRTIKEYEPIKKELGENVAFVYLTGPSSIEKTWKILIQDIVGERYWLNEKQWGYLWKHFQMKGLPMYLVIDKQGNIVKRFTHVTRKELEELLKQEINK